MVFHLEYAVHKNCIMDVSCIMEYSSVSIGDASSSSRLLPPDDLRVGVAKDTIFEYLFSSDDRIIFRRVHGRLCLSKTSAEFVDETFCRPADTTCNSFFDSVILNVSTLPDVLYLKVRKGALLEEVVNV